MDDEDYEKLSKYRWYLGKNGYVIFGNKSDNIKAFCKMHRLIINAKKGELVDHINRIKTDNRKENLRIVTMCQNIHNQKKRNGTSTEYKGVHMRKQTGLFDSICRINGKTVFLGTYKTAIAAGYAYNKYATKESKHILLNEFSYSTEELDAMLISERCGIKKCDVYSPYKNIFYRKAYGAGINPSWMINIARNKKRYTKTGFKTDLLAYEYLRANFSHFFKKGHSFVKTNNR